MERHDTQVQFRIPKPPPVPCVLGNLMIMFLKLWVLYIFSRFCTPNFVKNLHSYEPFSIYGMSLKIGN